jgi:hypothetical protein
MWKCLIALVLASQLAACGSLVRSNISVFHEFPEGVTGVTYAAIPFKEQEGSLEHKSYEQAIKRELNARGFREVPVEQADTVIFFFYGIDSGKEIVESYPIIGQTGTSSSHTFGTLQSYGNYGTYSGTTTYTPTYGVVGAGATSRTEYARFLKLDILDKRALIENRVRKLYEAKVTSRGSLGELSSVLPTMVKALFEEFPGKNGSTRRSIRVRE